MANALFVIYMIGLSVSLTTGYSKECAIGSKYWCKSFEQAADCGALNHCTDTAWLYDSKHTLAAESRTCEWCQKIFKNTQKGFDEVVYDDDTIISTLRGDCKLLLPTDVSSKCTNVIENYASSAVKLLKNKRYGTLCRLMNICTDESTTESPQIVVGANECTWGPSYWCSSLSNSRQCNSINHCAKQIWSQQAISREENDTICQYCGFIINKLRSILIENTTEIDVEKWLAGACSMLRVQEMIDECKQAVSVYGKEILILIENNIDSNLICHLGQMCKTAIIVPRLEVQLKDNNVDDQSKMLCNVIVRATHDLHINQQISLNEITTFLKDDCQKLSTFELKQKCEDLVDRHIHNIYGYVTNNMELSKVCDNIVLISDELVSSVHCELCTFVLTNAKYMLNGQHSHEDILQYIDENLCSHSTYELKRNCKFVLETTGDELIRNIERGTQSLLLCNYFQVCHDVMLNKGSPIQINEMKSFLSENICDQLGPFGETCHALMEKDTTNVLKTLMNNLEGDVLCQIFGLCQMKMSIMDNLSIMDDKNVCKRCVDDFTRRKHIAEKLLNHSSEFLHHLCGQLPQEEECTKSVDESMNTLFQFIRSLNPQDICVELKLCTTTLLDQIEPIRITSSNNIISPEIIAYVRNEICTRLGPLSKLCHSLVDSEATNLLDILAKGLDPHRVCNVIDICPKTTAFENCTDRCECCVSKIENYQVKLATFLQSIFIWANTKSYDQITATFQFHFDKIMKHFNTKQICQSLTHCSASSEDCTVDSNKCRCCQNHLNIRKNNFRSVVNDLTKTLTVLCNEKNCHSVIRMQERQIIDKLNEMASLTFCQQFGLCTITHSFRSMPSTPNRIAKTYHNLPSSIQLSSDKFCSGFGNMNDICGHLLASSDAVNYMKFYSALLNNNSKLIQDDLHEKSTDTCDQCKTSVQSSKDLWIHGLESARDALLQTCESCPSKDECRHFFSQRFYSLESYLNEIQPEQICQNIHLCSISTVNKCSTCVENFKLKKDGFLQAINRLTKYFTDLCQRETNKQCQIYIQEIHDLVQISLEDFDLTETCTAIGFCQATGDNNEYNFDEYVKNVEDQLEKNICSTLGSFETLCNYIVRGNTEQIQELAIDYNINDLIYIDKQLTEDLSHTETIDETKRDKCKYCIFRVARRKRHTKFIGDMIFSTLIHACHRCPARHECRKHWIMRKSRFNAHIDRINPKCVCIHLGYCNKSSINDSMGNFQDECKESIESTVIETNKIDDSNATCLVCEYVMNILSNYINRQSTQEEIEENLEKICNLIPSMLRTPCHDYIDNYGPTIIVMLLQEFNLSTICPRLNLCTNQMKIDITHIIKADTAVCGICDYISTYIDFALKRDSQEQSFQHAMSTVCTHLSDELQTKCQTIIQLISSHIKELKLSSGNNFCQELPLCQIPMIELEPLVPSKTITNHPSFVEPLLLSESVSTIGKQQPMTSQQLSETPKCTLCHYIISYLDAVLKNNKSEQAIEEALEKVCTILPSKERSACDQFVKSYGPVIAKLISDMADPDTVCRSLGICQDATIKTSTSYSECIFGIKYWCASRTNAELCNAVELCERQVWLKTN